MNAELSSADVLLPGTLGKVMCPEGIALPGSPTGYWPVGLLDYGLFFRLRIFTIRLYTISDKFQVYPPLVFTN